MKLLQISITNFRSFAGEQTFEFPQKPGLYFMQGRNEVEPRLGSNGAGKSTIWDAITWCLFNKTSRGLKAGDVCNWKTSKGTAVTLTFEDAGIEYVVTRTWGPISWKLRSRGITGEYGDFDDLIDLAKDPSNRILGLLRLEFSTFLNSVLTAQAQPMFLDQKADVQAALFSDVMGLDQWLGYAGAASSKASAQDSISRVLERKLSGLRGQLDELGGQDFTLSMENWEAERNNRLDELELEYKLVVASTKVLQTSVTELTAKKKKQGDVVAELAPAVEDRLTQVKRIETEFNQVKSRLTADTKTLAVVEKVLEHLNTTDSCPTCLQTLPRQNKADQLKKAVKDSELLTTAVGRDTKLLTKLDQDLMAREKNLRDDLSILEAAKEKLDALRDGLAAATRDLVNKDRILDSMEDKAESIQTEKNPYAEMQATSVRKGKALHQELEETQRLLDDSISRHSILSYWVKGFKEIRLQLIAEALNELEIEVNSCVASLGLVGWELNFQVDRETKGGGIQRGFSVLVRSPHNQLLVPWEAWSGGEAQRLRLAGNMGLADLIRSRSGTTLNLEVWDEPTKGLSRRGVQDLLESLATRANQEQRVIWLIDHSSHDFGGFAGGVVIAKTSSGSEIR